VLDEPAERRPHRVFVRELFRQLVARGADLERDLLFAQRLHQVGLVRGEDAVADLVRSQRLDRLGELLDAVGVALLAVHPDTGNANQPSALANRHPLFRLPEVLSRAAASCRACNVRLLGGPEMRRGE
jgi:hypothetical protein